MKGLILCHTAAFFIGIALDLIIGDPASLLHPIRLIGRMISGLEKKLLRKEDPPVKKRRAGCVLCTIVTLTSGLAVALVCVAAYLTHIYAGIAVEAILTCYLLAARSLSVESMKVYKALSHDTLDDARKAVSMIVGRDTDRLDEAGVTRAAVETVAENTSDGVIAPIIYAFIGGPVLGFMYKAINTMDSMVGYKNERYMDFGRAAAKTDDVVNYIPSRISALLMIAAAYIGGRVYSGPDAWRVFKRDRYNHKSPNSAQTESVCAGALRIRLGGPSYYFGKLVEKPYIGDNIRDVEVEDIKRSIKLMYLTDFISLIVCALVSVAAIFLM
ncbi:MAG: cobalamin biosynthesis protein CobD [Lachnospiraceae bacterium]|nr:cobalamin biosynthesis protein CobD [Lachnospiraceae bacterium]